MRPIFILILTVIITCRITVGVCAAAQEGETCSSLLLRWNGIQSQADDFLGEKENSPIDDIRDGDLDLSLPPRDVLFSLDVLVAGIALLVFYLVAFPAPDRLGRRIPDFASPLQLLQLNGRPRFLVFQSILS